MGLYRAVFCQGIPPNLIFQLGPRLGRERDTYRKSPRAYTVFTGVTCDAHLCIGPENGPLSERCTPGVHSA